MNWSIREKALLALLLVLGCIFVMDQYLFQPLSRDNRQLIAENTSLSAELQGIKERLNKYQSMEAADLLKQDNYQEMLEALPQSPLIPNIINDLESKARENNIILISIHYKENIAGSPALKPSGPEPQQATLVPVNFQITAHGSHYDLLSFVLALENAPRIYVINNLKIGLAGKERAVPISAVQLSNTASSVVEPNTTPITPELLFYDQGKSILNLDFNAFYHYSLSAGAVQP